MPRTQLQNEQIKLQRKNLIAECGLKVFCEKSFDGTQMTDIAKKAEISHALIYHYFKNKQELFDYVILKSQKIFRQQIDEIINSSLSNKDKLSAITDFFIKSSITNKNFPFEFFTLISRRFHDIYLYEIVDTNHKHKNGIFKPIKEIFESGIKTGEFNSNYNITQTMLLYFSIIHGAVLGYVLCPTQIRNTLEFLDTKTVIDIFTKK